MTPAGVSCQPTGDTALRARRFLSLAVLPLCLLAAASGQAHAESGGAFDHLPFSEDFDDAEKTWTELSLQLPAAPKTENLLPISIGPTATHKFAVDASSISIGADGVVRYTLVSTSPYGAQNITYEGIRCETAEQKLYAIGHSNGKWSRSRNDSWKRIDSTGLNPSQSALFTDYYCDIGSPKGDVKAITERLRKGTKINMTTRGQ